MRLGRFSLLASVVVAACAGAGPAAGAAKPPPFAQAGSYKPAAWMTLRDSTVFADNFAGDVGATYNPNVDSEASSFAVAVTSADALGHTATAARAVRITEAPR